MNINSAGRAELVLVKMCHNSPGRGEGSDRRYSNTVGSEGLDGCTQVAMVVAVVTQPRPLQGGGLLEPSRDWTPDERGRGDCMHQERSVDITL